MKIELNERCLKIDRPNALAMIDGYDKNGKRNNQSIWCDVTEKQFPMLITLNRSRTRFKVKNQYESLNPEKYSIPLKFIANLDSQYFVKNDMRLWEKICNNGLFDIWDPRSPYSRFDDAKKDPSFFRIQLLRISEINEEFNKDEVRPINNRLDHLITTNRTVTIKRHVILDEQFVGIKSLLTASVSEFRFNQ